MSLQPIFSYLRTLMLFTQSDFKTIILPVLLYSSNVFCYLKSPISTPQLAIATLTGLLWLWSHILSFSIENQTQEYSLREDKVNKPWRPIPSLRISEQDAIHLGRIVRLINLLCSVPLNTSIPSIIFIGASTLYNRTDFHRSAIGRNVLCAVGYASAGSGCMMVIQEVYRALSMKQEVTYRSLSAWKWLPVFSTIILTTIHITDLPDVDGDRQSGRRTLPVAIGMVKTGVLSAVIIIVWSTYLLFSLHTTVLGFLLFVLGSGLALLLIHGVVGSASTVNIACKCYCFWISLTAIVPTCERLSHPAA